MGLFGEELRRLRRQSGLSQETLAARAGLSPEAVSLLERGRRSPRLTTMRLLADAMRLPDADRALLFSSAQAAAPSAPSLPVFLDDLVGREADLTALDVLLERRSTRLITIVGPAGVGKTRVAVEHARRSAARFPDGIFWLPVGPLVDRDSLVAALASTIGARTSAEATLTELASHLHQQAALLVIDDAEQLLPVCRELATALLASAPRTKVMITSRHLLELPGEQAFLLPPLETPPLQTAAPHLHEFPASRLFLDLAQRDGGLTEDESRTVIRICHRVDGLPLALQLAAARTRVLTLAELADTLESELSLLSTLDSGGGALVDAMVDASYATLTDREKLIFERLSVFESGFSREAVRRVCGDEDLDESQVIDVLSSLSAKSLLERRDDEGTSARFRLLYLIKEYAARRLADRPDTAVTQRRHAAFYAAEVEQAAPAVGPHDQASRLAVVDRELGNVRRALLWGIEHEPELALRMVVALSEWIYIRGRYTDGRAWATCALAAWPEAPVDLRAPAVQLAGMLAFLQCDYDEAARVLDEARRLFIELGDRSGEIWCTARLGSLARERGDYDLAEQSHLEARRLAQQAGLDAQDANQLNFLCFLTWIRGRPTDAEPLGREALERLDALGDQQGVVWALINLGAIARLRLEPDQAELLLGRALDLAEEMDFREGIAWAQNQLGIVARCRGEHDRALGLQLASRAEQADLGDRWREASVDDELAALAAERGDFVIAARYLAAADRMRRQINVPVPAVERADREQTEDLARTALGSAYALAGLGSTLGSR